MVCLQSTDTGTRICLAAEGFGNRHCFLENIADKNNPPDLSSCVFVIEQALSVRALQEMITARQKLQQQNTSAEGNVAPAGSGAVSGGKDESGETGGSGSGSAGSGSSGSTGSSSGSVRETAATGGSRTLLYGHAVLLRHGYSKMHLACLSSTSSSSDKLAFDVGLQEQNQGKI